MRRLGIVFAMVLILVVLVVGAYTAVVMISEAMDPPTHESQ